MTSHEIHSIRLFNQFASALRAASGSDNTDYLADVYLIIHGINDNVLSPYVRGKSVGIIV